MSLFDLGLDTLLVFHRPLAHESGDSTLHLGDLELGLVQQLLLALLLLVQLVDGCLQVTLGGDGATDCTDQVGLFGSQFEQFL